MRQNDHPRLQLEQQFIPKQKEAEENARVMTGLSPSPDL